MDQLTGRCWLSIGQPIIPFGKFVVDEWKNALLVIGKRPNSLAKTMYVYPSYFCAGCEKRWDGMPVRYRPRERGETLSDEPTFLIDWPKMILALAHGSVKTRLAFDCLVLEDDAHKQKYELKLRCIDTIGRIFVPKRWKVLVWQMEVEFQVKEKSLKKKQLIWKSDWYCHRKWALHVGCRSISESRSWELSKRQQTLTVLPQRRQSSKVKAALHQPVKEFYPHVWLSLIRHVAHHSFDTPDMRSSGSTDTKTELKWQLSTRSLHESESHQH